MVEEATVEEAIKWMFSTPIRTWFLNDLLFNN